jgi:ATP/maltotriose-dependent transcriptional regulator MalT
MSVSTALDQIRAAFAGRHWSEAFALAAEVDGRDGLAADDLERYSTAAAMLGRQTESIDLLTRAHEAFLESGDEHSAARCAAWIGIHLGNSGEQARSAGWFTRAQRLAGEPGPSSSGGFLLVPVGLGALYAGDAERALTAFEALAEFGEQLGDQDFSALGRLGLGQARIMLGQLEEGFALFDDVMVAVTAGEVSPVPSGIIYCSVIGTCQLAFDLRRAQEWTAALDHWCSVQPDMVSFSGQCQSHRAELYRLHGAFPEALAAAKLAQELCRQGDRNALYGAYYQQGEIQRMRGELDAADESYRRADKSGFEPQPGLALLRLAQGKARASQTTIRRALEATDRTTRRALLPAVVEIELSVGDVAAARRAAAELVALAEAHRMPALRAVADFADGSVLLAEGDPGAAQRKLRAAQAAWRDLEAPHENARCRVLIGHACLRLGDPDTAAAEFEAAREVFLNLGAAQSIVELDASLAEIAVDEVGLLTAREIEVLRLVATGLTNRAIATELFLSEKTVARHLSNIFQRLGVPSRSAATAYAYEHRLVPRR